MNIQYPILTLSTALLMTACGSSSDGGDTSTGQTASGGTTSGSVTITTPNPYPAEKLLDETITSYLEVINAARSVEQDCGSKGRMTAVPALKWNDALYRASFEHSTDMAESNTFAHTGSGTNSDWTGIEYGKESTSQERIENNGYQDWISIGENITAGTVRDTAQKAVDAWLESDAHCALLMKEKFTEVGMALVSESESTYTYYWTQNFGTRVEQ